MFREFFKDSFYFAQKYYAYIFGLITLNMIIAAVSMIPLAILIMLFGMFLGVNFNKSFNSDFSTFSGAVAGFIVLSFILFLVWMFLLIVFVQYPFIKTMIEITRDKQIVKRPFEIYFQAIKEKNFTVGLRLIGLQILIMIILLPIVVVVGLLGFAATKVDIAIIKVILFILCIVGVIFMFYVMIRILYSQTSLIDKRFGVMESLKFSVEITNKKVGFILLIILYTTGINAILQIPLTVIDFMAKDLTETHMLSVGIFSVILMVVYFAILPYLTLLQYLPYNMLLKRWEDEQNQNVYVMG
ncbi:hypothetical protein [Anaerocellum diazotrophicum]|uniref:Glycerophosphoryl diester phosphodiesterase membrane domain-containing protein n=1 Tax=Caldicellulosiruptor diazotrophicus TaxID=2806205 RepID=A0ABM7NKJ4_9FIRM|nr:hypothetical protein [Caldicellulosiruptor diazotrophicus]BCS80623.1 hypothetical protein CaldiYA01_05830 [Caldicellulosiruptor diazotrophicus]